MRLAVRYRRTAVVIASLALTLLSSGGGHSDPELPPPPKPPISHNPKIESALEETPLLGSVQAQGSAGAGPLEATIELTGPVSPPDLAQLSSLGVAIEAYSAHLIRALLPAAELVEAVARLPRVAFLRRPYKPVLLEESLGPIGAVLFHAHRFKGQGVKMAVIDVGFAGLSWAIAQEVLPQEIIADATDYSGEGLEAGTNHGTAVAELAHKVAPQTLLYLKKIGDEVDLANAVDDCLRQGVQIIVHSVGWFNTNFTDGTGIVAELADRAHRLGILWVNAAGNHAQQHWSGPFRDADSDGWVEFQGSQEELKLRSGLGQLQLFLTWDDWPRSCQDYDLFLYDFQGNLVAASQNYQTCSEPPTEEIDYFPLQPGVSALPIMGTYYVRVLARNKLRPVALKLFAAGAQLEPAVPQGSLPAPADARGVLAVGAIPIGLWASGPPESFSSQGPTSDGRLKPELMAPDNVRTATEVGLWHRFSGTSAAAPQVAGAAALLLSQHPDWTAADAWEALEENAIDMGQPGKDNIYGSGRLNLSLGRPSAARQIATLIRPGDQAIQGGSLLATVRLVMPPSHFGGLVFQERIPPGLLLVPLENGGAAFDPAELTWAWPFVDPGSARTISYQLLVPADQTIGNYRLEGRINGQLVEGEAEFHVILPLTVAEAVAHWAVEKRLIDLELGERISRAQLEQALAWWLAAAEVPATGGKAISSDGIERLVAHHLTGTPVSEPLPSLPGREVAIARRTIAPERAGSLLVTVEVRARATAYGLRLSEAWPSSWQIEPLDDGGAVLNGSEWLWPRAIEPGEVLVVRYRARPTAAAGPPLEVKGFISSALPRFSCLIESGGLAESGSPELQLKAVKLVASSRTLQFRAEGDGIKALWLRLFDLAGRKLYDSGWIEGHFSVASPGWALANGVYLYAIIVRGTGGEEVQRLGKVVILR